MILGVDIGGTTVKLGVVDPAIGSIAAESFFPTPQTGSKSVAQAIAEKAQDLRSAFPELKKIGIGVPGAMNRDRSLVRFPPNLIGWKEEPLKEYIQNALPDFSAVEVDNDAKVAALAEAKLGAGRGLCHFALVTLGTGIGGAVYCSEGTYSGIYRGASGGAGEFGHTSIDHNGPPCNCGSRGCIEAYLGQKYLSDRTRTKLVNDPSIASSLRKVESELTPKLIADAMNDGDPFAHSVFDEAGTLLGAALANVANLLDMHTFIIGGGVAEAGEILFDSALRSLRSRVLANLRPMVEIRKAHFGNLAGIIGAAMLVA